MEKKIFSCLKKTFPNEIIKNKIDNLKINSLRSWDSIGNLKLLMNIEKKFKIKFSADEIAEVDSIKKIIFFLKKRA